MESCQYRWRPQSLSPCWVRDWCSFWRCAGVPGERFVSERGSGLLRVGPGRRFPLGGDGRRCLRWPAKVKRSRVVCGAPVVDTGFNTSTIPPEYVQDLQDAARVSGLPPAIIAGQIRAESNWNPKAVSHAGARGIRPIHAWHLGGATGDGKDPFDPHAGIAGAGANTWPSCTARPKRPGLTGDPVDLALAGYNAGWGGVQAVGRNP
ncbi:transglycosylase SLT domain-containing protein [Arthrobacter sp. 31Y]|uniref:transglycosylase SLT domain-containing protein n=1 Tax=Arthrobacter sp. 31Y TaxID=1115632 RepID=UPI0035A829C8